MNLKERELISKKLIDLQEDLNKVRWDLIGISLKINPVKLKKRRK